MKENVKERRTDFLSMWKYFWNPIPEEETEEEKISKDPTITESDKKELLKALKNTDKLSVSLFNFSPKKSSKKSKAYNMGDKIKKSIEPKSKNMNKDIIADSQLEK